MAKKDNNYDELENQIGDAGGKGLGKIEHKEILGLKGDLNEDEEESLKAFQKGIQRDREAKSNLTDIGGGWIPVDKEEMGMRAQFYPASWEFFIKAPSVQAIKNWTSVNEEDARQVNDVLNEIIRTSVKITTNSPEGASWAQINSWDRFWFIMKVREAAFVQGESKVEFEDECENCGQTLTYTLSPQTLYFEYPDEELVQKFWNGEKWEINPEEYGANHGPIDLYVPKLGKDKAIIEWATAKAQNKEKIDENFIRFLMWLLPKTYLPNVLDAKIKQIYNEYKSWDVDTYEFMDDVIRNLSVDPQETLKMTCSECGQETHSKVRFPNGIKKLFRTETKVKKFGSR